MNTTVTERDKRLLGFLAAFIIALLFFMMVFKPLAEKNKQLEEEVAKLQEQQDEYGAKASGAQDMVAREKETKRRLENVLSRFYPMQQSQDAERMVTTLMLNHGLTIQSLTVIMPEAASEMKWYQYSADAAELAEKPVEEETEKLLSIYAARVTCVAEGDEQALWNLVDDVSLNYPAISIVSTEWSAIEKPVSQVQNKQEEETEAEESTENDDEESDKEEVVKALETPKTVKTSRLTISFDIFMCNQ